MELFGLAVLMSRHIETTAQCPIFQCGAKDIKHLMFTYIRAKEVCKAFRLYELISDATLFERSGSLVLEDILCRSSNQSPVLGQYGLKEVIVVGAWYIW